jgi:hypothetical protein
VAQFQLKSIGRVQNSIFAQNEIRQEDLFNSFNFQGLGDNLVGKVIDYQPKSGLLQSQQSNCGNIYTVGNANQFISAQQNDEDDFNFEQNLNAPMNETGSHQAKYANLQSFKPLGRS